VRCRASAIVLWIPENCRRAPRFDDDATVHEDDLIASARDFITSSTSLSRLTIFMTTSH